MTFPRTALQKLVWTQIVSYKGSDIKLRETKITSVSRWSINYYMVFSYQDKVYGVSYSRGATECQDEVPFEYEPDDVLVEELKPVMKIVPMWESI